ncbi:hypothetical protein RQP46_009923 [Phenoliferia psychrophenolica]
MQHVLPLAPFPPGTKPGDTVFVQVDLTFDPTATDLCRRWRPGANLILSADSFIDYIEILPENRRTSLLRCFKESTDCIQKLEQTPFATRSPWVVTIFSFEDTPWKHNIEDFMCLFTCSRAPCSFEKVDWLAIWWNLIGTNKRGHVAAETISLASPLGDAFRVESAIEFREVIHATIPQFLSLASFPIGTKRGDIHVVSVSLTFDPTATDVCRRWRPRFNFILTPDQFKDYLESIPIEGDFSPLLKAMNDIPEAIKHLESTSTTASPWAIMIFSFKDIPTKGATEQYVCIQGVYTRAPCSVVQVEWVEIWRYQLDRTRTPNLSD